MKQLLENLIKEWWSNPLPVIKSRDINLAQFLNTKVNKVISLVGFRRVGKTFLLFDIAQKAGKERCVYINFEDERIPEKTEVLTTLIDVIRELRGEEDLILLLDEIQNVPNWSKWVRRVAEAYNYKIFLSGSSSRLSSSEIPTELRGRTITITAHPLTFQEFLSFHDKDASILPQSEILRLLREYIEFGGMPEVVLSEAGMKYLLIDEYFKTFLTRDIFERYKLRQKEAFRDLIKILLNSTYFTISKITNTLKSLGYAIGKGTVSRYVEWLDSSFFITNLKIYSPSIKNQLQCPKKVYCIDNFFLARFSSLFSKNMGRLMENAVAWELIQRKHRDPLEEIFYWKDYQQREIDFVINRGGSVKELIQVTYASSWNDIAERELESLAKGARQLKANNLLIITWDLEGERQVKGARIICIPLWEWLLKEPYAVS